MRKLTVLDTTLRDGEQSPGCSMAIDEKVELAKTLEAMGVDVIEAGFPICSVGDRCAVRKISDIVKNATVAALCRARESDIIGGYEAVQTSVNPRLHIFIATSPIHLEYKLKMTEQQVLEAIESSMKLAKAFVPDVQFSAEDATRTPLPFLAKAMSTAIKFGATTINVADTIGYCQPDEIKHLFNYLYEHVNGIEKVNVGVHCHNDLGMAVANTLSAVQAGVNHVETTLCGIGERSGNAAMEEVVMAINTRSDLYGITTNIDTRSIYKASKLLSNIIGMQIPPNKAIIGANVYAHESGIHQHGLLNNAKTYELIEPETVGIPNNVIVLGKHSGKHAFKEHLSEMGYAVTTEELDRYFEMFKALADKKKYITRRDLESIISHDSIDRVRLYSLNDYHVNSVDGGADAEVTLNVGNATVTAGSDGNGTVDALYKAVNTIVGEAIELTDYSVRAVTEGEDALGEAVVKLRLADETATGRGVDVDVIRASLLAYIDGINKLSDTNLDEKRV